MDGANPEKTIRIVVSMGDPSGIGPEICLKTAGDRKWIKSTGAALTIAGSPRVLKTAAGSSGQKADFDIVRQPGSGAGSVSVLDLDADVPAPALSLPPGPTPESGKASIVYIERAVSEILAGRADALVTCPVSKEALSAAGCPYPGHTEMLGSLTDSEKEPVMMMHTPRLRVAFVTTHTAIKSLPGELSVKKVEHTAETFTRHIEKYFTGGSLAVALCALNPHAGDGGRFGDEEYRILKPALDRLRKRGINVDGPLPSDSLFFKAMKGDYGGVIALYHDQGMIPVKIDGPAEAVNITIGLPVIRTSPAHGTAYDIAGKGIADPTSLKNAIRIAVEMAGKAV